MGASESVLILESAFDCINDEWETLKTFSSEKYPDIIRLYKVFKPTLVHEKNERRDTEESVEGSLFPAQVNLIEDGVFVYNLILINPHSDKTVFNLFRSESKEVGVKRFQKVCDLLMPYIDNFESIYTVEKLQSLMKLRSAYPSWSTYEVAAHMQLPEIEERKKAPKVTFTRQESRHQQETIELITREQPNFARDFFGSTPMQFFIDKHPELVANFVSTIDSLTQTGKDIKEGLDNITKYTESPIHVAIRLSQEGVLKLLLEKGANPCIACGHAYPIHLAVKHESKGCLKLLLEHDREFLKMKDKKYSASVLHWVKSTDQIDMLAKEPGVDLNSVNFENETPMHIMVKRRRLSPTISLICHGANINARGKNNATPLHYAVINDDYDIIRALLFLGASRCLKDDAGKSPFDYLEEKSNNYHDIKDLLELFTYDSIENPSSQEQLSSSILKEKTGKESLLALDGGGIRGIVLTEVLIALESVTGRPVYNLFDWISGTSTGSFLAVSIANGRSVHSCQRAYLRLGRSCLVGVRPYPTEQLDGFLIEEFGEDTKMDAFEYPKVILPAVVADRRPASLFLFRNYSAPYDENYQSRDARFPRPPTPEDQATWLAIRSSCSAPSYFRSTGRYLDGGLIATNPTLDSLSEIHKYEKHYDTKRKASGKDVTNLNVVLSIGTGRPPIEVLRPIDIYRPSSVWDTPEIVDNLKGFVDLIVDQVSAKDDHIVDRARSWCEMAGIDYYRFQPTMSSGIELNETDDRVLLDLLCDVRKYILKNFESIKKVGKILLGEISDN